MMINGNSLSTTDFWRVLDESAQNSQLDITTSSDDSTTTTTAKQNNAIIKQETNNAPSTFSGTFLRPEPPPPGQNNTFSPLKKQTQQLLLPKKATQQQQTANQRKTKHATTNNNILNEQKKLIKQEPLDIQDNAVTSPLTLQQNNNTSANNVNNNLTKISPSKFKLFMLPTKNEEKPTPTTPTPPTTTTTTNIEKTPTTDNLISATSEDISDKKLFKCLNCDGMILQGLLERSTHELAGHHVLYRCNVCVRDFEQESSLKKHLKTHRAVETRKDAWKKCPYCGKCLKLGSMWMHRKIHTDNKKYGCEICGQKFVQKINLTHHSRIHTSEKPYECPECQKR